MKQNGDLPVYKVRPEGQAGKSRVLHRNRLLPFDFLPSESGETIQERKGSHNYSFSESNNEKEFPGMSPSDLEWLQLQTTTPEQPTDRVQPDYLKGVSIVQEKPEVPFNAERTKEDNNPSHDN